MSVFVDAARVIFSLGSLGEQFKGAGSSNYSGEYLASSVTSMGADAAAGGIASYKMIQQYRLARNMSPEELADMKAGDNTSLILKTMTFVDIAELMTGFGPPCEGGDFTEGSQQLADIAELLKSALPDDDWKGSASDAYTQQVTTLRDLALKLADMDRELADITKNQAEWVTHMRLAFGVLKDLLMVAFAVEVAIKLTVQPPPVGLTMAQSFAVTVSLLGAAAAVAFLFTLDNYATENGAKATSLIGKYGNLAPKAVSTGTTSVAIAAPAAVKSSVSDFAAISRSMSGVYAGPDAAALTEPTHEDAASAPGPSTGAGHASGGRHARDESDDATPSTPAPSVPTLAPVTQMPRHAAQLDQGVALAQQSRKAQAPVEEAESVDDAEAAGGSEGAERAPIEFAVAGASRHRVA